ncbi:MAG TPA: hypothetical protein VGD95_06120 [Micavibrio sp.]
MRKFSVRYLPVYIVVAGILSILLTGCGIKPARLSPPDGTADTNFPRTYPDPATDPAPTPQTNPQ